MNSQLNTSQNIIAHKGRTNLFHMMLGSQSSATKLLFNYWEYGNLSKPKRKIFPHQVFTNNFSSLCLHVVNSSDFRLRLAPAGLKSIWYFSFKHSKHLLVLGSNFLPFSMILHFKSKSAPLSFSSQICVDKVVECSFFLLLKLALWPLKRFLKVFFVSPV